MSNLEFISAINALRLNNKNKWYTFNDTVNNKAVQIKGFGTWLQIFNIDGVRYGNSMETSIKEFKAYLGASIV